MSDLRHCLVISSGPIMDAAGLHGAGIGYVWANNPPVELVVDFALEHDNWVPITNPNPWMATGKQGWIKKTRLAQESSSEEQYLLTRSEDGSMTIKRLK